MMKEERMSASMLFCRLGIVGAGWLIWNYARLPLTVALIAWGVGAMMAPVARVCARLFGISRRVCGLICFLGMAFGVGGLLVWGVGRLAEELSRLTVWLLENRVLLFEWIEKVSDVLSRMPNWLPIRSSIEDGAWQIDLQKIVNERLLQTISALGNVMTAGVVSVLVATPRLLLGGVIGFVACAYTSMDYELLRDRLIACLPTPWRARAKSFGNHCLQALGATVRAYGILTLLTFAEVLLGLSILGVRYALLLSLVIAAVDLLPILGTGCVLIPWAIVALLCRRTALGVGLLILYLIITVTRQVVAPHLLGKQMGIHPLVSLFAMLTGMELFGFWGMVLAPILVMLLKPLFIRGKASQD